MTQYRRHVAPLLVLLACSTSAIVMTAGAAAPDRPATFREILATRPAADLGRLADRSMPDGQGPDASESFWDVLKLRDAPDPAAVPVLERILDAHAGSSRIHGFAAAQALFAAGTDDARRALERHLRRPDYPAAMAVGYTSHWEMAEPARSRFLAEYLLSDLADDLDVTVHPRWEAAAAGRRLVVTVKLRNASPRNLIVRKDHGKAAHLYLRGPSGAFAPTVQIPMCDLSRPEWLDLGPGDVREFDVALRFAEPRPPRGGAAEPLAAVLEGGNGETIGLRELGRYRVYAMLVEPPLTDQQKEGLRGGAVRRVEDVWAGRAVSPPAEIEITVAGK